MIGDEDGGLLVGASGMTSASLDSLLTSGGVSGDEGVCPSVSAAADAGGMPVFTCFSGGGWEGGMSIHSLSALVFRPLTTRSFRRSTGMGCAVVKTRKNVESFGYRFLAVAHVPVCREVGPTANCDFNVMGGR